MRIFLYQSKLKGYVFTLKDSVLNECYSVEESKPYLWITFFTWNIKHQTVIVCWLYEYCHFVPLVFCDCVAICSESSSLITNLVDWFAYGDFGWHPLPLLAYSHQHGSGIKMSWCTLLCIMLTLVPEYLQWLTPFLYSVLDKLWIRFLILSTQVVLLNLFSTVNHI